MSTTNTAGVGMRGTEAHDRSVDSSKFNHCIALCSACAAACNRCAAACIARGASDMAHCITLDLDCAAICNTAAGVMARNSENAGLLCSLCADICKLCAAECAHHDALHFRRCAEACQKCEAECQHMATA